MDNDALNLVDQFKGAILAVLQRLHGPAPTAIENRGGSGDARGMAGVLGLHDADKGIDGGPRMAARQRTNFGQGFGHFSTCVREDWAPVRGTSEERSTAQTRASIGA